MYQIYYQFGYHNIQTISDEDFEKLKKTKKWIEWEDDFFIHINQRMYAWKVKEEGRRK